MTLREQSAIVNSAARAGLEAVAKRDGVVLLRTRQGRIVTITTPAQARRHGVAVEVR